MEIRFGTPLLLTDGSQSGTIQRVVLESETQRVRAVTIRVGFLFARERIVGAGYLVMSDDERRLLAGLSPADIGHLPCISDASLADASGSRDHVQPYSAWTGGEVPINSFVAGSAAVNRRVLPSAGEVDVDRDVTLVDGHTTVHGVNGSKLGTVSAVVCDSLGTAIGLLIRRSQMFRSREIYVPTDMASYTGLTTSVLGMEWNE
jgi:uncharacterized protein YrrD